MEIENNLENSNPHKNKVHKVLVHSYSTQFILFLIGICLDFVFQFKIFMSPLILQIGIIILILGSFLILSAQRTSRSLKKENMSRESFYRGPYRYTRSPTHLGLFLLILGFGIIVNAPFVILSAIISFIIAKFIFLNKQETILAEKYGSPYLEYKKMVKF